MISRRNLLKTLPLLPMTSWLSALPPQQTAPSDAPNILIMLFDTWSAPHLSLLGYERDTTPHINALADKAIVYHRHYATAHFTTPATSPLLTSSDPWQHRAFHLRGSMHPRVLDQNFLAMLQQNGYTTLAQTQNGLAQILLRQIESALDSHLPMDMWSLFNGTMPSIWFDMFDDDGQLLSLAQDSLYSTQRGSLISSLLAQTRDSLQVRRLLEQHAEQYPEGFPAFSDHSNYFLLDQVLDGVADRVTGLPQPFAAYFHLMPPHTPYRPRAEFIGRFNNDGYPFPQKPQHPFENAPFTQEELASWNQIYDEFIAYVDFEFGRLYAQLQASGVLDNTILILTSDHGELFERGISGHTSKLLYDGVIHIPLVIFMPDGTERIDIHDLTSCLDIAPTIRHWLGLPPDERHAGTILPPYTTGDSDRSLFALNAKENSKFTALTKGTVALMRGPYKLMHFVGEEEDAPLYELYNLEEDPHELNDIYQTEKGVADVMTQQLQAKLDETNK